MSIAARFQTSEQAQIEIYGKPEKLSANVKNISLTGACIEFSNATKQIKKGDLVRLTVFLNTLNRRHLVNAEVIWSDGKKTGVCFVKSNQILEKMIEKG